MNKTLLIFIAFVFTTTFTSAQTITYGSGTQLIIGNGASLVTTLDLVAENSIIQIAPKGKMTVNSANGVAQAWIASTVEGTGSLITHAPSNLVFQIDRYVNFTSGFIGRIGNISSPVQSSFAINLEGDALGSEPFYVKSHLESNRGTGDPYTVMGPSDPLNIMEAYSVYHAEPKKILEFIGQINSGDFTLPITSTEYSTDEYYGWNLIGNPYPSAISIDSIVNDAAASNPDLIHTVYYLDWSSSVWLAYNQSMGPSLPYNISIIPVGQGFFIKKVDGTPEGVFTLKDKYRVHDNNNYNFDITAPTSKNQDPIYPPHYFELVAKNTANDAVDKVHYRWRDDATTGFDVEFDSYKLEATGTEHPNIFFYTGNTKTAIQQEPATKEVGVGFSAPWTSGMQVEVTIENIQDFTKVILEDKNVDPEDTFTDLSIPGSSYSFTQSSDDANRFVIHLLLEDLSDKEINEDSYRLYSSNKEIYFISPDGLKDAEMKIFDSLGRCVKTTQLKEGDNKQIIHTVLNTGIYIVKVSSPKYSTSKTLLIK